MVAVVLANLQVHIRSVHVRYVDNTSSSPFAFGFTIHGVQLQVNDFFFVVVVDLFFKFYSQSIFPS